MMRCLFRTATVAHSHIPHLQTKPAATNCTASSSTSDNVTSNNMAEGQAHIHAQELAIGIQTDFGTDRHRGREQERQGDLAEGILWRKRMVNSTEGNHPFCFCQQFHA